MRPIHSLWRIFRAFLAVLGAVFLLLVVLALTSAPFWIWYRMGAKYAGVHRPPDYIVVLGGGGMPSESGLMRCWYSARAGEVFPGAKILIALPGDTTDSLSSVCQMKAELVARGIDPGRISFEASGTNTRAQALNIRSLLSNLEPRTSNILLITSPEHLKRAVLTFKKAGFLKVDGIPAFEEAIESDITFQGKTLGGRRWVPDIGDNLTVRYRFWTQMHYEILVLREWMATAYYRVKGWI
jgi:uncharacterized SAM-binding protein YcdF (DUF218 family)